MPLPAPPTRLLTIAEYAALGEIDPGYTELIEGRLVWSPSPGPQHQVALLELAIQLRSQLPPDLVVISAVDIDLGLVAPDEPGFSRRPDLVVVTPKAVDRVGIEGGMLHASEVHLVVELVSSGSRRTDHIDKRRDYADAGIAHYWIVDIAEPASAVTCDLIRNEDQSVTGTFSTREPFPIKIDLERLRG
jgi:Uma2 family endonuclease